MYAWRDSVQVIYLDFAVKSGDTISYQVRGPDTILTTVSLGFADLFGRHLRAWTYSNFRVNDPGQYESSWWIIADSLAYAGGFYSPGEREYLLGAIIDGKTYGTITGIQEAFQRHSGVEDFVLLGAYPNPFNSSTQISISLKASSRIDISVYDVRGALIRKLAEGMWPAGSRLLTLDASALSSGVYFVRLIGTQNGLGVSTFRRTFPIVLLR